ncbi:MAG: lipoyl synthase [Bacteroidetes bacterium]|nr:lipoyl synthase [Bacteroidota bacterium]
MLINTMKSRKRQKPDWLKINVPGGREYLAIKEIVTRHGLNTICTNGQCPNICDCWGRGTATLMILGDVCTRSCKFCAVKTGKPAPVDNDEPRRIAESVKLMNLKHCVLTSVDRDDLRDGGAGIWAETINAIKSVNPDTTIEALIPDFQGKYDYLVKVIDARPEVISHNLETVRRITPQIRSVADYDTSLQVIKYIAEADIRTKSGIMVGLGEIEKEVYETMNDLLTMGCAVFTIGQYLQPSYRHLPVIEFVTPEKFEGYRKIGLEKGFKFVESGPLVRSSYHAERHVC